MKGKEKGREGQEVDGTDGRKRRKVSTTGGLESDET